jgi:hypothetical protein
MSWKLISAGLDLGQSADYSAVAVLESGDREPPRTWACRHLYRWRLGTAYPTMGREVAALTQAIAEREAPQELWLAVDGTGVGRAVVDLLLDVPLATTRFVPITITGGDSEAKEAGYWHVPKRHLVGVTQVALQTGRLKIASALPEAATLTRELQGFQMKISLATGHDSYGAWREHAHDDVVLALACALWCGEKRWPRWRPVGV